MKTLRKSILLIGLFSVFFLISSFVKWKHVLIVESFNGTMTEFLLSEQPQVHFLNNKLKISVNDKTSTFELTDVKNIYFKDYSTGIDDIQNGNLRITYLSEREILVESSSHSPSIKFYSLNGSRAMEIVRYNENYALISLESLPSGIYIIEINNQHLKLFLK